MPPPPRIPVYLGGLGPQADAFRRALPLAAERAAAAGLKAITIAVPTLSQTQGIFDEVLGETTAAILRRHYRLDLKAFTIYLATQRRPPSYTGPVVAAWTTHDQNRALLANPRVTELWYVPWTEENVASFQQLTGNPVHF